MRHCTSFLGGGFGGSVAVVKADEQDFVIAARIERKHPQRTNDALLYLIAQHGAVEVDEREDDGLLAEVTAEPDVAAGLVTERCIKRHLRIQFGPEVDALQSGRHGCR